MNCPTCNLYMVRIGEPYHCRTFPGSKAQRYRCPSCHQSGKGDVIDILLTYNLTGAIYALKIASVIEV